MVKKRVYGQETYACLIHLHNFNIKGRIACFALFKNEGKVREGFLSLETSSRCLGRLDFAILKCFSLNNGIVDKKRKKSEIMGSNEKRIHKN